MHAEEQQVSAILLMKLSRLEIAARDLAKVDQEMSIELCKAPPIHDDARFRAWQYSEPHATEWRVLCERRNEAVAKLIKLGREVLHA